MVYTMVFEVDGGCRRNGQPRPLGAAACCLQMRSGRKHYARTERLPSNPSPTNQRAEITAISMALKWALEKYDEDNICARLNVIIKSDSKYAVNAMSDWIYKWSSNGWVNSAGYEVANRDLIQQASRLDDRVRELGSVRYEWIPREDNIDADRHCNDSLDEQEDEEGQNFSSTIAGLEGVKYAWEYDPWLDSD
ncbi:ribonuclease H-like domain-containing protein [Xylariaceae sp. FL1019]|nr:ribonuclease H-like domain-containing protein [Xylariaceae sp. FL1019]